MVDLANFADLVRADHGLSVVSTLRSDGTIHSSLVNASVVTHPLTGVPAVGYVALGSARKLEHLRRRPQVTVTVRGGWQWQSVEGTAELIGPDDPRDGVDADSLRVLLREIFTAAGGTHDDWATYDQVMIAERRTAVLIAPARAYPASRQR